MDTGLSLLIICFCIFLQGFFSGSEMTLVSTNRLRLMQKAEKGFKGAGLALKMINNPQWFLATTSTGTCMFVIISSVVAAVWLEGLFGAESELLTIIIISPLLLMFGEIIPRTISQQRATEIAPKIAHILWIASYILLPLTFLVFWANKLLSDRAEDKTLKKYQVATREELALMLNTTGMESDVKGEEKRLIHKVFYLAKSDIEDVMVPLINVMAISVAATVEDAIKVASRTGHSRLPVFKDRIDNLIGAIYARDLLGVVDNQVQIGQFTRKVPFVPELKRADDLLVSLQKSRNSIAIVVDEYGGAVGIVTIEDILEEVVGDIGDEHDHEIRQFVRLGKNRFMVNARIEIEDINEHLKLNLPKEDYETLGGFLLKRMGRIPRKGEIFKYRNIKFTIWLSGRRSIHQIIIEMQ